jgi:hypothetical protein
MNGDDVPRRRSPRRYRDHITGEPLPQRLWWIVDLLGYEVSYCEPQDAEGELFYGACCVGTPFKVLIGPLSVFGGDFPDGYPTLVEALRAEAAGTRQDAEKVYAEARQEYTDWMGDADDADRDADLLEQQAAEP